MAQKLKIDIVARDKSKQALNNLQGNLSRLKSSIFNVQNAFIGLGAGLVIRNVINTGKQIENLQVQLKFLFGSAQEGAKAFDEMAKFASKVPFSLEEIQRGSGVLAVVSDDSKELANLMKITGNVAAVTGLDFKTTAEQIQRSLSAGISAADLFRDKGVKEMLGFKAGATVSIEDTIAAFERVFGEGGKFDGATDQLAKTFSGTLSMIGDKVFNFKRVLLDAGFFSELKQQFGDLNKAMEENSETLDKIAFTIGKTLGVVVAKIADSFRFLAEHAKELGIALKVIVSLKIGFMLIRWGRAIIPVVASMRALVSLSGVGLPLVAASVAASVATFVVLGKELDKIEEKINASFKDNKAVKDRFSHELYMFNLRKKNMENLKEEKSILGDVNTQIKKINKDFDISKELTGMIKTSVASFSKSIAEAIVLGKELNKSMKELAQSILVSIIAKTIERIALKQIEKVLDKAQEMWENRKLGLIYKQNAALRQQMFLKGSGGIGGSLLSFALSKFMDKGGAVSKGKPIVVGERGPEVFVPNQTGQITQNARGVGGSPVNVNFTINAIDTRGFQEALIQNRGTISNIINQAVNERGAKNLI